MLKLEENLRVTVAHRRVLVSIAITLLLYDLLLLLDRLPLEKQLDGVLDDLLNARVPNKHVLLVGLYE